MTGENDDGTRVVA